MSVHSTRVDILVSRASGSSRCAGTFRDAGLLDELIVQVGSATLGKGKPLFPRRVLSPVLQLASVRQMGAGMAELRYEIRKADQPSLTPP